MTYTLPEEHGLLRQTVRELADAKIARAGLRKSSEAQGQAAIMMT